MQKRTKPEILRLLEKDIAIADCRIIFNEKITAGNINLLFEFHNSRWTVEDGWLTGINPGESAGMAIFKQDFPGNVMLEFECRTVPPSTHDINFMWNGEWSDELNSCKNAYIGSICGWHQQRIGVEKSPDYKFRVTVPNQSFVPGRIYKVMAGSIDGNCFIFTDDVLVLEADDPDPIDSARYNKAAFTAWSSHIQFRNIILRQISWKPVTKSYTAEF